MLPTRKLAIRGMAAPIVKVPAASSTIPGLRERMNLAIATGQEEQIILGSLPEDFRALLYVVQGHHCLKYSDVEDYCANRPHTIDLTNSELDLKIATNIKLNVTVDISAGTPVRQDSFNILPYITIYLTFPQILFSVVSSTNTQALALSSFARNIVYKNLSAWKKYVLNSGYVQEVRIWWREKSVDIVLQPGSAWALTWQCGFGLDEGYGVKELKRMLDLSGPGRLAWKGEVVIGSVEEEAGAAV